MSEFCPENVNRSDARGVSSQDSAASVAPQEEWAGEEIAHEISQRVVSLHEDQISRVVKIIASRLREDKKQIERLRKEVGDKCEEIRELNESLDMAREALEKIATEPLHDFEMQETAASALRSLSEKKASSDA